MTELLQQLRDAKQKPTDRQKEIVSQVCERLLSVPRSDDEMSIISRELFSLAVTLTQQGDMPDSLAAQLTILEAGRQDGSPEGIARVLCQTAKLYERRREETKDIRDSRAYRLYRLLGGRSKL